MGSIRSILARLSGRYRYRVVAGLLVVSLPITVVLAVLLTRQASNSEPGEHGRRDQEQVLRS